MTMQRTGGVASARSHSAAQHGCLLAVAEPIGTVKVRIVDDPSAAGKRKVLERTLADVEFHAAWPASIVHACASAEIIADRAATKPPHA